MPQCDRVARSDPLSPVLCTSAVETSQHRRHGFPCGPPAVKTRNGFRDGRLHRRAPRAGLWPTTVLVLSTAGDPVRKRWSNPAGGGAAREPGPTQPQLADGPEQEAAERDRELGSVHGAHVGQGQPQRPQGRLPDPSEEGNEDAESDRNLRNVRTCGQTCGRTSPRRSADSGAMNAALKNGFRTQSWRVSPPYIRVRRQPDRCNSLFHGDVPFVFRDAPNGGFVARTNSSPGCPKRLSRVGKER
jgi:hypothetical protein